MKSLNKEGEFNGYWGTSSEFWKFRSNSKRDDLLYHKLMGSFTGELVAIMDHIGEGFFDMFG